MNPAFPSVESIPRIQVLGVPVSAIHLEQAVQTVLSWATHRHAQYVCVREVNGVMDCQNDPELLQINQKAGLITPDGMPLFWLTRLKGFPHTSRVCGRDLMFAVCQASVGPGLKHFFYGGAPGVAERLVERLQAQIPGLSVAGTYTPPFRPLTPQEDQDVIRKIVGSGAHLVWIGISSPKQEYWMRDHVQKLGGAVLFGVGAAFDFHAGTRAVAPRWMQKTGLEWLFRLASEPRRLWKRYLVNNPKFVWFLFLESLGLR